VLTDRLPLHQPAKLYPVGAFDYDIAKGAIRTLYRRGLKARLIAASELAHTLWRHARSARARRDQDRGE
jgi:hypothetical protein